MNLLEFAEQLIRIPSISGSEGAVIDFAEHVLRSWGATIERIPVTPGRDNLYASWGKPHIVFTTHLDVVPAPEHLFSPRVVNGRLYGRGACDCKGIAAAMASAVQQLRAEGVTDVGILFVVGEETDGDGAIAAALALKGRGINFLINGEPTELTLVKAHKGVLSLEVTTTGKSCHSGYPERGDSAVHRLIDGLARLRATPLPHDPVLGDTLVNIGKISGGVASNVVAPAASAVISLRSVSNNAELESHVREVLGSRIEVRRLYSMPATTMHVVEGFPTSVVAYGTDVPHLQEMGAKVLLMGPGTIHVAHTDEESIALEELTAGVAAYVRLAKTLHGELSRCRP